MENPGSSAAEFFFGLLALTGVPRYRLDAEPGPPPDTPAGTAAHLTRSGRRGVAMGILVFRGAGTLVPLAVLVTTYGPGPLAPILAIAAVLLSLDALALVALRRGHAIDARPHLVWLTVAMAGLANVAGAATVPDGMDLAYHNMFWTYLAGAIMLVTVAYGPMVGVAVVVGSVSLQVVMAQVSAGEAGLPDGVPTGGLVGRTLWLGAGVLMAAVANGLVSLAVRLALEHGIGAGRAVERARVLRSIHDTVLQTLEAMALESEQDRTDPHGALARLRGAARQEARRLRGSLSGLGAARRPGFAAALAETLDEIGGELRVRLVVSDLVEEREPTPAHCDAVLGALREALSNVRKHAGVETAVVHVDVPAGGGIQIVIRDHGQGFDAAVTPPGFGTRESIVARLDEVGGSASIESWPQRGTRVRLWVPA